MQKKSKARVELWLNLSYHHIVAGCFYMTKWSLPLNFRTQVKIESKKHVSYKGWVRIHS